MIDQTGCGAGNAGTEAVRSLVAEAMQMARQLRKVAKQAGSIYGMEFCPTEVISPEKVSQEAIARALDLIERIEKIEKRKIR